MRIYQPKEGPDRLPQAMVEGATEYDWSELPDYLQEIIRQAARDLTRWSEAEAKPIQGELVNELPNPYRSQP